MFNCSRARCVDFHVVKVFGSTSILVPGVCRVIKSKLFEFGFETSVDGFQLQREDQLIAEVEGCFPPPSEDQKKDEIILSMQTFIDPRL